MKMLRKGLSLILILTMIFSTTGCKKDKFTHDGVVEALEELKVDEYKDLLDFRSCLGPNEIKEEAYIRTDDKDETADLYNLLVNRLSLFKEYKITEITAAGLGDEGLCYAIFMTFKSDKKAEHFYDEFVDQYDLEEGDNDGDIVCSNGIVETEEAERVKAIYMKEDKVLVIFTISVSKYDKEVYEDFLNLLDLEVPED